MRHVPATPDARSARILALLPDIHRRPTGGNLFNRRVLDYLERVALVERAVVEPDGGLGAIGPADVTLVDSLLLTTLADSLAEAPGRRLLIAHYLHLFDPAQRDSEAAQRERRHLPLLDGVVTTSRYCRQALIEQGFSARRVAAVTPGLAAGYDAEGAARPAGTPRILTVSTLLPGKGLRQLLSILEGLADLAWTWELAGDPGLDREFATAFRRGVEASPIAGRVRLHGAVDPERMIALYDRCHLFALPSRFESCSMATMEAMARGLPVVAYRVGGVPERIPAATSSLLAPAGDGERFAANLRRLLAEGEAADLGHENRRASGAFPGWEACGAELWTFLRRFVARGAA